MQELNNLRKYTRIYKRLRNISFVEKECKSTIYKVYGEYDATEENGLYGNKKIPNLTEPDYLLPLPTLIKIYQEFDGKLWKCIAFPNFCTLFDMNNSDEISYEILKGKINDFCALLWKMYNVSQTDRTQEKSIKPLLERGGGAASNFDNIIPNRINSSNSKHKKLMAKIDKLLK
ncbi:hypothetical protein [Adhaeribacter rhizoryzae]|uniref:Uncharacterized protein n=1 Tax=Adhaeribacter rhizoryzae TaxID=2607907 RepID=A0A5M6DQC2_9BACT|nr:hypothetical protein [Adhaeribacter rhizoryzae]KAA5548380.1 hypothetical protein F0145_06540 [Adhaeribacter rhizoryzae]